MRPKRSKRRSQRLSSLFIVGSFHQTSRRFSTARNIKNPKLIRRHGFRLRIETEEVEEKVPKVRFVGHRLAPFVNACARTRRRIRRCGRVPFCRQQWWHRKPQANGDGASPFATFAGLLLFPGLLSFSPGCFEGTSPNCPVHETEIKGRGSPCPEKK